MKLTVMLALVSATQAIKVEEKSKAELKIQAQVQTKQMIADPHEVAKDL